MPAEELNSEVTQTIDSLSGLIQALKRGSETRHWFPKKNKVTQGRRHCSVCGGSRSHDILVATNIGVKDPTYVAIDEASVFEEFCPATFWFQCRDCAAVSTVLIYEGPAGYDLVVLPSHYAGARSPHTPEAVAYYLDQAQRSRKAGARSAAVAMYRAALEQLLYDQGYTRRMLGPKIEALETEIKAGKAPAWAKDFGTEEMSYLKDLGNGSVHPNGGDITLQKVLDDSISNTIEDFVVGLLNEVYEGPAGRAKAKALLRGAASAFAQSKSK